MTAVTIEIAPTVSARTLDWLASSIVPWNRTYDLSMYGSPDKVGDLVGIDTHDNCGEDDLQYSNDQVDLVGQTCGVTSLTGFEWHDKWR